MRKCICVYVPREGQNLLIEEQEGGACILCKYEEQDTLF